MYYGNTSATSQQDASNVWDSNFKGVWHLKEDPSTITRTNRTSASSGFNYGTGSYTPGGTFTPTAGTVLIAHVVTENNNEAGAMNSSGTDITISGGS